MGADTFLTNIKKLAMGVKDTMDYMGLHPTVGVAFGDNAQKNSQLIMQNKKEAWQQQQLLDEQEKKANRMAAGSIGVWSLTKDMTPEEQMDFIQSAVNQQPSKNEKVNQALSLGQQMMAKTGGGIEDIPQYFMGAMEINNKLKKDKTRYQQVPGAVPGTFANTENPMDIVHAPGVEAKPDTSGSLLERNPELWKEGEKFKSGLIEQRQEPPQPRAQREIFDKNGTSLGSIPDNQPLPKGATTVRPPAKEQEKEMTWMYDNVDYAISSKKFEQIQKDYKKQLDLIANNKDLTEEQKINHQAKILSNVALRYGGKKILNEDIATQLLKEAGGDKNKARQLAKRKGFIIR